MTYNGAKITGLNKQVDGMGEQHQAEALDYRVRVNRRVRQARITMNHHGEVIVVLPRPLAERKVAQLVAAHASWITARRVEQAEQLAQLPASLGLQPPQICLSAIDEQWSVHYDVALSRRRWQEQAATGELQLQAAAHERAAREALQGWLHQRARQVLTRWLEQLGEQIGLRHTGVTIRAQKTRWGSCSSNGNINLNRNLLFLSADLVEYLLIHELCHLREPNHSPAYWELVARHLPDYRLRDQALRDAVARIPLWARPGG